MLELLSVLRPEVNMYIPSSSQIECPLLGVSFFLVFRSPVRFVFFVFFICRRVCFSKKLI